MRSILILLLLVIVEKNSIGAIDYELSNEFIDSINELPNSWTAGRNFREDIDMEYVKSLVGSKRTEKSLPTNFVEIEIDDDDDVSFPEEFDSRVFWPECTSIGNIRDQGNCDSSWIFAPLEVMADRICIESHGKLTPELTANDVMSCCDICGDGCDGGDSRNTWDYWIYNGIATGGPYDSHQGCKPYKIAPCDHHVNGTLHLCSNESATTPGCVVECEPGYPIPYLDDRYFGNSTYSFFNASYIQADLFENGPVQGSIGVYSDFLHYKSGVYQQVSGSFLGVLDVKIIGWGVENDLPYWLVTNSWNYEWGDQGLFKILRGSNECGIEIFVNSGKPQLKNVDK